MDLNQSPSIWARIPNVEVKGEGEMGDFQNCRVTRNRYVTTGTFLAVSY
jgi:hypothetical protein